MPCASLLDTRELTNREILNLFERADRFKTVASTQGNFYEPTEAAALKVRTIAGLFLEASTRTRMSFQVAAQRLGHRTVVMDGGVGSSMAKGETDVDTVLNIAAMKPDAIVIRYNVSPALDELLPRLGLPVISAGSGTSSHPTQALLDAYTIRAGKGRVEGQRVLIVGDIIHSRVASSNFDVLNKLGAEIAVCGPEKWLPQAANNLRRFDNLDEAMSWANVYMGLRVQMERHSPSGAEPSADRAADGPEKWTYDYHRQFGLTRERLQKLSKDTMILHPGPINHGVEFCAEVMQDSRARILEQVTNGVLVRAAILERALGERQ